MKNTKRYLVRATYRILKLFAIILISIQAASSQSKFATARPFTTRKTSYLDHSRKAIATLHKKWLTDTAASATWTGVNAWQRFVIADSLMEYTKITGDRSLLPDIELAVANKEGLDGNDDDLWAVISSLNLYELKQSPQLLQFSQKQFTQLTDGYWDNTCGGGMWWDHERTYKNAITNELLLYASTLLFQVTRDHLYYEWAFKEWDWFNHSGLINNQGLINDGLDMHCSNNHQKVYTYNQGVILGALTNLYQMDKDRSHIVMAKRIAEAAISNLSSSDGVLIEPTENLAQDGQSFKGIFIYHLGHLFLQISDNSDRRIISTFIAHNAQIAWDLRNISENEINAYWDNAHSLYGAAAQSAGVNLFNAAVVTAR